ncbi:hypothetical protein A943_19505 [Bacillus sp. CPSM8]|nr:hypothetical protein A943_19505 [Bacillus sp. CPSM8]TWK23897.1 hypothetical protein CHCC20372_4304 [Bacillus paralicheniformis]
MPIFYVFSRKMSCFRKVKQDTLQKDEKNETSCGYIPSYVREPELNKTGNDTNAFGRPDQNENLEERFPLITALTSIFMHHVNR